MIYRTHLNWTGARSGPASDYRSYSREYQIDINGKPPLTGSADPTFLGDALLHNPEDLLVAALSACHMLSYLAFCSNSGIVVLAYTDDAVGVMEKANGHFHMSDVLLSPEVTIAQGSDPDKAKRLHLQAHTACFIARSVNFPVRHQAVILVQ